MPNQPENTAQNFPGPLFSTYRATPPREQRTQKSPGEGLMNGLVLDQNSGGIEILVNLATKGDIDPKNIDIIDVTDRFLKAIAAAPKENLRQSGKIIFHASVLLRMKAEALLITKLEDLDVNSGDDFLDFDEEGSPMIYDSNDEAVGRQITLADLQKAIVRQARQRQSRHRRVTLEQLIESLREAERLEKQRVERQRQPREEKAVIDLNDYHEMRDMEDILDLAHDEDIEDVIARVDQLLARHIEEALRLALTDVIKMLNGKGDWVDAFLAVLFLSNSGKLTLEQEVFYGPLYILKGAGEPPGLGASFDKPVAVQLSLPGTTDVINCQPPATSNSVRQPVDLLAKLESTASRSGDPSNKRKGKSSGRAHKKQVDDLGDKSQPIELLSLLEAAATQADEHDSSSDRKKPRKQRGNSSRSKIKSGTKAELTTAQQTLLQLFENPIVDTEGQCADVESNMHEDNKTSNATADNIETND